MYIFLSAERVVAHACGPHGLALQSASRSECLCLGVDGKRFVPAGIGYGVLGRRGLHGEWDKYFMKALLQPTVQTEQRYVYYYLAVSHGNTSRCYRWYQD